ncbi:MAG TPA: hypothetical protein VN688_05330 [Gemmataceae bacterium]|nr:hypothetical protein [Gemmataceae bacterium]
MTLRFTRNHENLLQHGLLKASFVPPEPIREWRDLTALKISGVSDSPFSRWQPFSWFQSVRQFMRTQ